MHTAAEVKTVGSLLDIPAQLALLLSLAAAWNDQTPPGQPAPIAQPAFSGYASENREGPMRFSERSWLRALHGLPDEAERLGSRVFVTSGGRYYVPLPDARLNILAARKSARIASQIAQAAARANARRMAPLLKRPPVAADLYIAHIADVSTAVTLVAAVEKTPDQAIAGAAPQLAAAFGVAADATLAPLSVEQFYRRLIVATAAPPRLIALGLGSVKPDVVGLQAPVQVDRQRIIAAWRTRLNAGPAAAAAQ